MVGPDKRLVDVAEPAPTAAGERPFPGLGWEVTLGGAKPTVGRVFVNASGKWKLNSKAGSPEKSNDTQHQPPGVRRARNTKALLRPVPEQGLKSEASHQNLVLSHLAATPIIHLSHS